MLSCDTSQFYLRLAVNLRQSFPVCLSVCLSATDCLPLFLYFPLLSLILPLSLFLFLSLCVFLGLLSIFASLFLCLSLSLSLYLYFPILYLPDPFPLTFLALSLTLSLSLSLCVPHSSFCLKFSIIVCPSLLVVQPPEWEKQYDRIELKDIDRTSDEWHGLETAIRSSLPNILIISVKRIQNTWLWEKYCQHRQSMSMKNDGDVNEMKLYHGTRQTDPENIYRGEEGFDMRFSSDGLWGRGNYFATKASYSDMYAHTSTSSRFKLILVASVLVGKTADIPKDRAITKPPIRVSNSEFGQLRYDSVTGITKGTRVYITYSNQKAYPSYLVTYVSR